jgi:hypothetical protein
MRAAMERVGVVGEREQAAEGWGKALTQLVRYLNNKEDIWKQRCPHSFH